MNKVLQLANRRVRQCLFRSAFDIKSLSSNNNYSTKAKKEHFIKLYTKNNKLMNTFVVDIKKYSSLLNNNTTEEFLNPIEYESWPKEDVCSLLCTPELNGGAGLCVDNVQPLFDAGFDGTSLAKIVTCIQEKDTYFAIEQVKQNKDYQNISQTTLKNVVFWVDNLLKTRLYHLWTNQELLKFLSSIEGAKLNEKEVSIFENLNTDEISNIISNVLVNENVKIGENEILLPEKFCSWVRRSQLEVRPCFNLIDSITLNNVIEQNRVNRLIKLGLQVPTKEIRFFVIEHLLPLLQDFEFSIQRFETNSHNSKLSFNREMKKLGVDNSDSLIYINQVEWEKSASCTDIACSFAPTFPKEKYQEKEHYLKGSNVLTFVEAPGSGKTHFGFHLTQSDRLVIPIGTKHVKRLIGQLEPAVERLEFDRVTQRFTTFYYSFANLLLGYAEMFMNDSQLSPNSKQIKQYILRFLYNSGGDWVGKQDFQTIYTIFPNNMDSLTTWILDEAQTLQEFPMAVPYRYRAGYGDLITLMVSSLRNRGSVVLTTTLSSVDEKIEHLISRDAGKARSEMISYQFKLLPLLNSKEVIQFLNFFISTNKVNDNQLWDYVGFFLKGTIRNTETFLQILYKKVKSLQQEEYDTKLLIHECLDTLFTDKLSISFSNIPNKFEKDVYKKLFYKLAIDGEVKLNEISTNLQTEEVTKFLVCMGISFNFENSRGGVYKLVSFIEKARLLKHVYKIENWFDHYCDTLMNMNNKKNVSLLAELFIINFLQNNFKCVKQLVPNSYVEQFSLESEYFIEDDDELYRLMLQSIANNVSKSKCILSKFLSRPEAGQVGRHDIFGMLKSDSNDESYPNFIPLSIAISRANCTFNETTMSYTDTDVHDKMLQDFVATDMYLDKSLKKGMKVRLLIHPNQSYSNTLKERVESGLFTSSIFTVSVKESLTDYSVILNDNSCLIEICSGIENDFVEWKSFMSQWNKYFKSRSSLINDFD